MVSRVVFSHGTDEWETPQDTFDALDKEFHFTLDPCSTDENAKCKYHFTEKEDGLKRSWGGEIVFCNPPYSQITKWVQKASEERTTTVMLIPARTNTKWFHKYIYHRTEIRFIKGRLKYSGAKYNAPFPTMIVIFRNN